MRKILLVTAVLTMLGSGLSATADEYDYPGCFWNRPTDQDVINVFYPDEGATYWGGRQQMPPGSTLVLRGTYPYARYMSFNLYDEQLAPTDALADVEIAPDAGSTNPFEAGADRTAAERSYTMFVKAGPAPATREPNTLYTTVADQGAMRVHMLYRVYVTDAGRNLTGDVGLPSVDLITADGTVFHLTARCDPAQANQPVGSQAGGVPLQDTFADGSTPGLAAATFPASDPVVWEKFFNLPHVQAAFATAGTPARPLVDEALGEEMGGYLSNAHNAYIVAMGNRGHGPVLVITGKAPTAPRTRDGAATMGGGDMRYWSICTNERHSTRWIDCAVDEDVIVDGGGTYTVVVSSPADRPANATAACGVTWLAWGTSPETLLILRHMLPDAGFAQAIQNVARPGDLATVMGDYLPTGSHTTKTEYEARGC